MTITVNVQPIAPATGTVTGSVLLVIDGGTPISLPVVDGVATYTTTTLSTGAHTVSAAFAGGANFVASAAPVALAGGVTVNARSGGLPATGSDLMPAGQVAATLILAARR